MEEHPMADKAKKPRNPRRKNPTILERINPNAAGVDCGSAEHYVAVPSDRDPSSVRAFKTFTADLNRLADWLVACDITTVAMEATGVYWIPLYEILEARGLEVVLVNARHVKNVPGRKSDVRDCEWLQQLHSVGLLRGSFRPSAEITTLRSYVRHRDSLVRGVVNTVNRMEKSLVLMNLQLHLVVSDLVGGTGLRILRDLVAGQTDPRRLATHRDIRCKASEAEIEAALTGNCRPEHLFMLRQNLELYDTYQLKIRDCDAEIETCLHHLADQKERPENPLPPKRGGTRAPKGNEPRFDIRSPLYRLLGIDLTQIDGIGAYSALRLVTEVGTDMSRWPTERHFTSWMTLAPRNRITGGRLLGTANLACANRAATMLRTSAVSIGRTQTALGAFYRRLSLRTEKAKAITATARKLAILVYRTLKGEITYKDPGVSAYDIRYRASAVRRLRQRAAALGLTLVDPTSGEIIEGQVS
jgi:transposase